MPIISQKFFLNLIFTPSFFKHFNVLKISSDFNKLYALDFPIAWDAKSAQRIDKLLSPLILIFLLKTLIFFILIPELSILTMLDFFYKPRKIF